MPQQEKASDAARQVPARLELLETHYHFEADGSSRKEVHTIVKINSELGVRQFAHLNFDYNRAFETVEIPLVRVTHSSGGTADVLPSAITDNPSPAVADAPAYQDVRVKSVRILGLEPADTLEYRVITNILPNHPLAPDFWLDHSFDRTGVVSHEIFDLDVPIAHLQIEINPDTPATEQEASGEGDKSRRRYRWDLLADEKRKTAQVVEGRSDVALTTFSSWAALSGRLLRGNTFSSKLWSDAMVAAGASQEPVIPEDLYRLVSQKITTVDIPLELSGYVRRDDEEVLKSGYGSSLEKASLFFFADTMNQGVYSNIVMYGRGVSLQQELPRPTLLVGALLSVDYRGKKLFLDPDVGVAPFGVIPADLRGHKALVLRLFAKDSDDVFEEIPRDLPFAPKQKVSIEASISSDGELKAKVKYIMRGDNELLLRLAFHEAPREKWNEVAQLLSLSDGFRGKVTSVSASDPYATREPLTVEYEISQPKFVDWSKKPVRIPAILPLVGLPDPPAAANAAIELGTPLEVETEATLKLPAGFAAQAPAGTSVARDYATFASKYGSGVAGETASGATLTASRHINFLARELPPERAVDYRAFLRAVQNDEAQTFLITGAAAEKATPASEKVAPAKP
ncbi:MAG: DUF3857 domain-containing protein [Candidatus Acidiferrum sp.]